MATLVYNFNFRVIISGAQISFMKISGIERNVEVFTYAEGGLNEIVHVFPGRVKQAGVLHLETGVAAQAISPFIHTGQAIDEMRIEVLNAARKVTGSYVFKNLVISKWSVSDLDARSGDVLIDRFDVTYGEVYVGR